MFVAKNNDLIIMAKDTEEELNQAIKYMVCTSIEETGINYQLYDGEYLTPEEIEIKERQRIAQLFLTAADVERAIYKDKGIDFDDILEMLDNYPQIDKKAVKIEFKANNFYRGNPYVNQIGQLIGYTSEQLDYLFENGNFEGITNGD